MYAKNRVWCHIGYITVNVSSHQEFINMANAEMSFLGKKKWHRIPKGILVSHLPSYHPYWRRETRKDFIKSMEQHMNNLNECIKDYGKIRFMYNSSANIQSIQKMINDLHYRIYFNKTT